MRQLVVPVTLAVGLLAAACQDSGFSGSSGKRTDQTATAVSKPVGPQTPVAKGAKTGDALGTSKAGTSSSPTSIGTLTSTSVDPGPAPTVGQDNVFASVDSACSGSAGDTGIGSVFGGLVSPASPPQQPLPPTVPADCRTGFEINNFHGIFDLQAKDAGNGSRAITLEVDIATYQAADRIRLLAETGAGEQVILDTCRLKTANYSDPTDGNSRPPEDSVRYYRPNLPAGTKALRVDFSGSVTPQYIKVLGLCDFGSAPTGAQGGDPSLRPAG